MDGKLEAEGYMEDAELVKSLRLSISEKHWAVTAWGKHKTSLITGTTGFAAGASVVWYFL